MEEKVRSFPSPTLETLNLILFKTFDVPEEKSDEELNLQILKDLFLQYFNGIFELLLENGFTLTDGEDLCLKIKDAAAVRRLSTVVLNNVHLANSTKSDSSLISSVFPEAGMEQFMILEDGSMFRHGSSLRLMSQVTDVLNEDDFEAGLTKDWEKSQTQGRSLYFAALEVDGEMASVLRGSVAADDQEETIPKLLIDYLKTKKSFAGRGLATKIVQTTRNVAKICGMDLFVLALESSAVFWLKRGFILEKSAPLNKRFNSFSDTFLLKDLANVSGKNDTEVDDITAPANDHSNDEADDEGTSISDNTPDDESNDRDVDLQRVLFESMK